MDQKQTYVERMLESSQKVTAAAEKALTFAEETGLTLEETEEIPGTIESILKKNDIRATGNIKGPAVWKPRGRKIKDLRVCHYLRNVQIRRDRNYPDISRKFERLKVFQDHADT